MVLLLQEVLYFSYSINDIIINNIRYIYLYKLMKKNGKNLYNLKKKRGDLSNDF